MSPPGLFRAQAGESLSLCLLVRGEVTVLGWDCGEDDSGLGMVRTAPRGAWPAQGGEPPGPPGSRWGLAGGRASSCGPEAVPGGAGSPAGAPPPTPLERGRPHFPGRPEAWPPAAAAPSVSQSRGRGCSPGSLTRPPAASSKEQAIRSLSLPWLTVVKGEAEGFKPAGKKGFLSGWHSHRQGRSIGSFRALPAPGLHTPVPSAHPSGGPPGDRKLREGQEMDPPGGFGAPVQKRPQLPVPLSL